MRVATWNINHVTKRLDRLLDWLDRTQPDVVALQELKTPTAEFPAAALKAVGYESLVVGQRTWNGVALLGRGHEPLPVTTVLPGDPKDKHARYVEAAINGVLFGCLYLPNGNPWPGPKFDYKLQWFERLRQRAAALWASGQPVVLLGDWNVVPTDADIYKPDTWRDNALLQPQAREAFAAVLSQGWTDALQRVHPKKTPFTFWDYRRNRWERDAGLRIDHILVGAGLTVVDAGVDREERGQDNASDHAPVWAELRPAKEAVGRKASKTAAKRTPKASESMPAATPVEPLAQYNRKRDFKKTAEPAGTLAQTAENEALQFVIQKHWASRLHYDFRLELDGVMVSWAVPKGPSYDPAVKQMAIHVEDHPLSYNTFEGTIPKGEYGGGTVIVWDRGTWEPVGDPRAGLVQGKVLFMLHGQKLAGLWELVRISKPGEKKQDQWMLFKKRGDAWARPLAEYDVITALPDSVVERPLGLVEEREPRAPAAAKLATPTLADLSQAVDAPLPATLAPQLATLTAAAPPGTNWVAENKFDGYRMLARIDSGTVRLFTRNGNDWTAKLQQLATEVETLGIDDAWLDGEIVVLNDHGVPDFNRLQNAIDNARSQDIVYFLFDAPFLGGQDLRQVPLLSRRAALKQIMDKRGNDRVRFSDAFDAAPAQLLEAACQIGLEGILLKRADAPYTSARSETWLKLKCQQRQEFVVIGFTDRSGARNEVGGLLLGYHEAGSLRYGGSVGTGWSTSTGRELHAQMVQLEVSQPAVDPSTVKPGRWSKRSAGTERWVKPEMVVEVAFAEWTPDGHVRHPTFRGVRSDKPGREIKRERPKTPGVANGPASKPTSVKVTHPERVIDPTTGLTKVELVRYYESIAEWMLPHLKDRPISLVRAPTGITGELFFQKHPETKMPGMTELDPALWPGHSALLAVNRAESLVAAAQMNTVEFHTWNSTATRINSPDRVIFDLDPGEGTTWAHIQEAALLMRSMLQELGLNSWLKTSGGKGLHVVVPLAPKRDYTVVRGFSQAVVQHMARVIPQRFVAKSGGSNRVGKIFIDYLRNGHGQTTAAAFSARSRPGLGVSMPVSWEQLMSLKSGSQWTILTAREYLSFQKLDPWSDYWTARQTLTAAMKKLGYTP
ncbi:DNA ligase D [Aquincola tertiaricarbonis]|uniref:DNA ligase D n=1 Tax=Aquincola tertiaricarbonis TaxID=391953 RepID=UPI000614B247|nr:DNA ligase D [Aquincola tertiaricarbonis]